ncbi:heme-binding beta-barrel domain-containing protein, partial [Streptomyces paradoxus]
MIEIPSDLHKDLVPLVFLLGDWAGAGVHDFPGDEKCNFGQEVSFTHDGRDFLEYRSH